MDRRPTSDSPFILDVVARIADSLGMLPEASRLQFLVLKRVDPSQNMARYYVLSIEPTLFDEVALVREWRRIGTRGRRRLDLYADRVAAAEALETWLARKTAPRLRRRRMPGRSLG